MGPGYSAFGSQKWIAELRPKGFFQKRKTPVSDPDGRKPGGVNYEEALSKTKVEYEGNIENFPGYKNDFPLTAVILCLVVLAVSAWLVSYFFW